MLNPSMGMPLELPSSLWGKTATVQVDPNLAHFAGLAFGEGYPAWGEVRVVTSNSMFADRLTGIVHQIAAECGGSSRVYVRPGEISDLPTLIRRALFHETMRPRYDSIYSLMMDEALAPDVQGGLSDAEAILLLPQPIEYPHGRIFAMYISDRRLLGIARLSLVSKLKVEPGSVRTRLSSKKGRRHTVRGIEVVTRKNNYLIEILSGGKRKWLDKVGRILWHPEKLERARILLATYSN